MTSVSSAEARVTLPNTWDKALWRRLEAQGSTGRWISLRTMHCIHLKTAEFDDSRNPVKHGMSVAFGGPGRIRSQQRERQDTTNSISNTATTREGRPSGLSAKRLQLGVLLAKTSKALLGHFHRFLQLLEMTERLLCGFLRNSRDFCRKCFFRRQRVRKPCAL